MAEIFELEFPQSLAVYDRYSDAQKAVDHLSDHEFPVQNLLIVGTDLKQVERVTGRLTWNRVGWAGALSGAWFGLLIGTLVGIFAKEGAWLSTVLTGVVLGVVFGTVWAVIGYAATRGQRDFSSVKTVLPSKYEVLVEHRHQAAARELLAQMPGASAI